MHGSLNVKSVSVLGHLNLNNLLCDTEVKRGCARARARARVCVCVCVSLGSQLL